MRLQVAHRQNLIAPVRLVTNPCIFHTAKMIANSSSPNLAEDPDLKPDFITI
jgi:hypothetical protein